MQRTIKRFHHINYLHFAGWCIYCYGKEFWSRVTAARNDDMDKEEEATSGVGKGAAGHPPLTSVVSQLTPSAAARLLEFHVEWAEAVQDREDETVTDRMGPWLHALLARLEKPLYPDVESAIRSLALICSRQRAKIIEGGGKETNVDALAERVTPLTLFVCIVAKYFGQADLADE